jgi:hypothetical protein
MAKVPDYVKEFMKHVPSIWDDVRFIDGYPGKFAVIARLGDGRWHVSGINGTDEQKALSLDLGFLGTGTECVLITDGESEDFSRQTVTIPVDGRLSIAIKPHGGFVLSSPHD